MMLQSLSKELDLLIGKYSPIYEWQAILDLYDWDMPMDLDNAIRMEMLERCRDRQS